MQAGKRNVIEVTKLIDLTEKPVGLDANHIGWAKVRSSASNCICCCADDSITLVTTDASYALERIPLDKIQSAQASPSLQYLAISNSRKLAVVDLNVSLNLDENNNSQANRARSRRQVPSETRYVDLAAHRISSMSEVIFWRWLDDNTLAILSHESLFTCQLDQTCIKHPAQSALASSARVLNMERLFDVHEHLADFCQVTDIKRDFTESLYAISSLYAANSLPRIAPTSFGRQEPQVNPGSALGCSSSLMRPTHGSMPSRLSQLARNNHSFDSLKIDLSHELQTGRPMISQISTTPVVYESSSTSGPDEVCGLIQIYCRMRDRTQLIQAQASAFTCIPQPQPQLGLSPTTTNCCDDSLDARRQASVLVAVNQVGDKMRVHFVEMATPLNSPPSSGLNSAPTCKFDRQANSNDFPTSVVCSTLPIDGCNPSMADTRQQVHLALITTKFGQLYVCSVAHGTILFNTSISSDIISSTLLDYTTQGLFVICRNGQVILVRLKSGELLKILDASRTLRHIHSSITLADDDMQAPEKHPQPSQDLTSPADDLNILVATKL